LGNQTPIVRNASYTSLLSMRRFLFLIASLSPGARLRLSAARLVAPVSANRSPSRNKELSTTNNPSPQILGLQEGVMSLAVIPAAVPPSPYLCFDFRSIYRCPPSSFTGRDVTPHTAVQRGDSPPLTRDKIPPCRSCILAGVDRRAGIFHLRRKSRGPSS